MRALLVAKGDGASLDLPRGSACGSHNLEGRVATAAELTDKVAADPLTNVIQAYHRFRRQVPRMLRVLDIETAAAAAPLLQAARVIKSDPKESPGPVAACDATRNGIAI